MQALIVHDDFSEVERLGRALSRRGFMVTSSSDQRQAQSYVRRTVTDLLVLKQQIGNRHTTSVALAAEHHNPRTATILMSERPRADAVELFELIPSLQAVLGMEPEAQLLASLGLQAVQNPGETMLVLSPHARLPRDAPRQVA